MRSDVISYQNVEKFLNKLNQSEMTKSQAIKVAVSFGFTPGGKIIDEIIRLGHFRLEDNKLIRLRTHFSPIFINQLEGSLNARLRYSLQPCIDYALLSKISTSFAKTKIDRLPLSEQAKTFLHNRGISTLAGFLKNYHRLRHRSKIVRDEFYTLNRVTMSLKSLS